MKMKIVSLIMAVAMLCTIVPVLQGMEVEAATVDSDSVDFYVNTASSSESNYSNEYTFVGDQGVTITVPQDGVYKIYVYPKDSPETLTSFILNSSMQGSAARIEYLSAKSYDISLSWSSSYKDSATYILHIESFTDSGICGDAVSYTFDFDGTLEIKGNGDMYDYGDSYNVDTSPWYSYLDTIKSLIIGEGVTKVGNYAFFTRYGSDIESISLPSTLNSIGDYAFYCAYGQTTIYLPTSLETIGKLAFFCCDLTQLSVPDSVRDIGSKAFYSNCISELDLGSGLETIGDQAFAFNDITEITIPANLKTMDGAFYGCDNIKSINVDENNSYFKSVDGIVYSKDGKSLIICPPGMEKEGILYIPEGTEVISDSAFYGCTMLTSIVIPEGVTTLGDSFAAGCTGLESLYIPSTVTNIVAGTFFSSTWYSGGGIKDIYYGGSEDEWDALITSAGCWQTLYDEYTVFHWNAIISDVTIATATPMPTYTPSPLPSSTPTPDTYVINGVTLPLSNYMPGVEHNNCYTFAAMVYKAIWNTTTGNDILEDVDNDDDLEITEDNTKKYITAAELGANIRVEDRKGINEHSMILVQKDEEGFTVYHGNVDGLVDLTYYTYAEFAEQYEDYKYFTYIIWPEASPTATSSSPLDEVERDSYGESTEMSFSRSTGRWSDQVTSYIYQEDDYIKIVDVQYSDYEYVIYLDTYDLQYNLIKSEIIPMELDLFGGFYCGEDYNYIVYGQENMEEDDSKEVIRIVKYDKNFNRLESSAIKDCYTTIPFRSGSLKMSECENELVIHTSRQRYLTEDDGLRHQSNLTIVLDTDDMSQLNTIDDYQGNHVSHSFNQFVQFVNGDYVLVDHGDGYPRGVALDEHIGHTDDDFLDSYNEKVLFEVPGEIGANCTGITIGGFEYSDDNYLIAINTIDHNSATGYDNYVIYGIEHDERDIVVLVSAFDNNDADNVKQVYLTDYIGNDKVGSMPYLVKISDDEFLVLWEELEYNGDTTDDNGVKFAVIDGNGDIITTGSSSTAQLSEDCQPTEINGEYVWYVNNEYVRDFYSYNPDTNKISHSVSEIETTPTATPKTSSGSSGGSSSGGSSSSGSSGFTTSVGTGGSTSYTTSTTDTQNNSFVFNDVDSSDWYYNAVKSLYGSGVINGTSSTTFSPDDDTTRGMVITMIYRISGETTSASQAFSDVSPSEWYGPAIYWGSQNNIVSGVGGGLFEPDRAITREEIVKMLYGYVEYVDGTQSSMGDISTFADYQSVSDWAEEAMSWAVGNGVISGYPEDNTIRPQATATRAELAQIIYNYTD